MPFTCRVCKKFMFSSAAVQCVRDSKHAFHRECLDLPADSDISSDDIICPVCKEPCHPSRQLSVFTPIDLAAACSTVPASDPTDSILTAFLSKMSRIKTQLRDLATIKSQLSDLSTIKPQLVTLDEQLFATTDTLAASISNLREQQATLDRRMDALEADAPPGGLRGLEGIESRLEALERAKLSYELIIFGVIEPPSEILHETVSRIAAAIVVNVIPDQITACIRIPAKGSRPPLIIKLATVDARNRWITGKRTRGKLDGSDVPGLLPDVNERLPACTRQVLGEARRAVADRRLLRSWVRNGLIHIRRHANTPPIRIRDRAHLQSLIAGAPLPSVGRVDAGPSFGSVNPPPPFVDRRCLSLTSARYFAP